MHKVSHWTDASLSNFRRSFNEAVKELEEKTGVNIKLGNISYSSSQFTSKVTVTVMKEGESPEETEGKESLKQYGFRYGMSPSDYGTRLRNISDGLLYSVVGIKHRSRKYPIILKNIRTGQSVKVTEQYYKNVLQIEK